MQLQLYHENGYTATCCTFIWMDKERSYYNMAAHGLALNCSSMQRAAHRYRQPLVQAGKTMMSQNMWLIATLGTCGSHKGRPQEPHEIGGIVM